MQKEPIIQFKDFTFQYFAQSEPTLYNIDLNIYPGEKILIVGPSGSGKSTLGHCLNGLIPFAYKGKIHGSLKVKNIETKDANIFKLSKNIGTVLQDADGQFVGLNVGEDIAFSLENDMVELSIMKEKVMKMASIVDMENFLNSSCHELSGGQKQRVSLAGVMVDDVDILLFDEPLANLDPATGKVAIELIDDIHKKTNKTIIIIEHRIEDVLHCDVDRIIVIDEGRILMDASSSEVLASNILSEHGIREPLYVSACKYANININANMHPENIDKFDLQNNEYKLRKWYNNAKRKQKENNNESILKVEHLNFSYDGVNKVLDDINFEIYEHEMVAIVGKNGAGKSTLSKIIVGFENPDSGNLILKDHDIKNMSIKQRGEVIGYVLQNPNQMICKTMIYDEVALGLRNMGISEEEIKQRVTKTLKICGLSPFIDWPISALSYGQKKRVTIASILVLEPKIIILDEPTAGQDYYHYSEIMEFLKSLNEQGQTIILITHDMHLMLEYTKRAIVLANGKKIADNLASEVLINDEWIKEANLNKTSLYTLAKKADIDDALGFINTFIQQEKELRTYEN
ncbi:MAG: ABC transporter ATP-binding protein [Firmicutes bacterium]|nr:ABC transporter ATP-binding protein [Erysipelotrichaceae bacterium]MCI7221505.1 ABC transporter ATP-binding protein [Erysipelotrichaceae bacterium]MDD7227356.1 ABC transporter ATP-binding protein [Bacillota bacterium]